MSETADWRENGVRIVRSHELDHNTPQTPGMTRAAAINYAKAGANKLWAGTVQIQPDAKTGAHHHGELESVIYVISGRARMRWGDRLEFVAEAEAGDFIYVPPFVPHQEINANPDEPLSCILVRSDQQAIVVTWILSRPRLQKRSGSAPTTRSLELPGHLQRHRTTEGDIAGILDDLPVHEPQRRQFTRQRLQ